MLHVRRDRHSALFSQVPLWVTQGTGLCWPTPRTRQSEAGQEVYGAEGQQSMVGAPMHPAPPPHYFLTKWSLILRLEILIFIWPYSAYLQKPQISWPKVAVRSSSTKI